MIDSDFLVRHFLGVYSQINETRKAKVSASDFCIGQGQSDLKYGGLLVDGGSECPMARRCRATGWRFLLFEVRGKGINKRKQVSNRGTSPFLLAHNTSHLIHLGICKHIRFQGFRETSFWSLHRSRAFRPSFPQALS
jgi:hypothetical protein